NVVPDGAQAEIDIRSLPGQEVEDVDDHVRKAIGPGLDDAVELIRMEATVASSSPTDGPLWDSLVDA
ncbi:MAG: peptidase dimerization domain-containing protein, partial [Actinobacteria bacterium]|nr:M20/M25/M40 family metallo-hydrolase [Actinomycetota bacterium]NIV54820.1 peptidase dimerization domain-containing protein [Actinomycetota bacterium]NIX19439.1 peptidase dimerization domain-containing protein [Actinomycetota bacterium]